MSTTRLPDYRLKQKILYIDKTSAASLIHYGDLYFEAGSYSDALDFYAKAGHQPGMQKIKDFALENGDAFLFQQSAKALGLKPEQSDWENVARKAFDLKKFTFAKQALEKTNNADLLNALTTKIKAEEAKQSA